MKLVRSFLFKQLARIVVTSASTLLSACMVGPDYERPAAPQSQHYDAQAEHQLVETGRPVGAQHIDLGKKVDGDWWSAFGSAKLDQVMRKAIDGNLDLQAADATIARANEAVAAAGGGLLPQVDLGVQGGRQRTGSGARLSTSNFYAAGPQVSFHFDLFGGTKRLVEERTALADLQRHRFDAAYLTVTGDVASQAFLLASARAQIDAVQDLLADDRKNLELVRAAHAYGSATQIDVALAATQLAQDETLLPPLAQQRDTARHALSVLAGKGPADWVAPDFDLSDFALPANLPVSLPSEAARNRPDILEAEARLHAASAAIAVATADLYPHLQLSASLDQIGPGIGTLWSVAGALTGPIFHGGALKANRRASIDSYKASLAGYQQTVIAALGQVADVLQAINHDTEEFAAQERALNAAEVSLRLNRAGYRAGEIDVLQVLDAERTYQRALIGKIRAKTARYLDTAQLSVALGGNSSGAFERRLASRNEQ
ncbi:efflux transporter outer membrane subunit [Rhodanobacter glycinis]|uniref:Efflux transporter outer membrane subunit n=1 Tax=Rhodanobacter glycinis TaxID=582702 RepID=A0A502BTJ5_9GAMM|nr:efflux transporter outer membrane subunit [Rhodanobacter glycinis]TPG04515.1 efflux transporter outer membrane subunit [Rhodanobacter glycinis]TPG49949.1 efflux transporter outer membrane subunit [Rhodanobacter glycinis]